MSYPATQTFWIEPTEHARAGLRRYARSMGSGGWTCDVGWHEAKVWVGQEDAVFDQGGRFLVQPQTTPHNDQLWPRVCERDCGYVFTEDDPWQELRELLYQRAVAPGETFTRREAPVGAMWDAWWLPWRGLDGISLMVRLPNGNDWSVDSKARNCTLPGQEHFCWVRHDEPKRARVTVDKNGQTCSAGAGSIASDDYHGFLMAGVLTAG